MTRVGLCEEFTGLTWGDVGRLRLAEIRWLSRLAHRRQKAREAERRRAGR